MERLRNTQRKRPRKGAPSFSSKKYEKKKKRVLLPNCKLGGTAGSMSEKKIMMKINNNR